MQDSHWNTGVHLQSGYQCGLAVVCTGSGADLAQMAGFASVRRSIEYTSRKP